MFALIIIIASFFDKKYMLCTKTSFNTQMFKYYNN